MFLLHSRKPLASLPWLERLSPTRLACRMEALGQAARGARFTSCAAGGHFSSAARWAR